MLTLDFFTDAVANLVEDGRKRRSAFDFFCKNDRICELRNNNNGTLNAQKKSGRFLERSWGKIYTKISGI